MLFIEYLFSDPAYYISWVVIVTFSICVHECAHAGVAATQGDTTALDRGFFSLNPMVVMGERALIALALFGIAWGAVPVNPARMRHRHSHLIVACAGPDANLALAAGFSVLVAAALMLPAGAAEAFVRYFHIAVTANCFLLIFNMLPIPMFDGWQLYTMLFPRLKKIPPEKMGGLFLVVFLIIFVSPVGQYLWTGAHLLSKSLIESAYGILSTVT